MDAKMKAKLADVYERAAEYLEEYGWTQHIGHHGGPRCFMGAIGSVTLNSELYYQAARVASQALALPHPYPSCVGEWNDDPTRTKDEVINTLHALANKLR